MRRALSVRSGAGRPPAAAVCRVRALARVRLASSHVSSYGRQTRSLLQRCCSAAPHCGSAAVSGSGACAGPSGSCVCTAIARAPQRFLKAPQLVRTLRLGAFGASELQLPRTASCAHGFFLCGVSSVADSCGRTGQPADRAPVSRLGARGPCGVRVRTFAGEIKARVSCSPAGAGPLPLPLVPALRMSTGQPDY